MLKNKKDLNFFQAWTVHFLTCSGLIAGFFAVTCIFNNNLTSVFLFLGIALLIVNQQFQKLVTKKN